MIFGTVKSYDDGHGYGFIARDDGGPDVFLHISAAVDADWLPQPGDAVAFEMEVDKHSGRRRAARVTRR